MKHISGENYNSRVEVEAESYRDKQFLEEERLQNEYEKACEGKGKELLQELKKYQIDNYHKLSEKEWNDLNDYFVDYQVRPETDFEKILDDYIDEVVRKYDFLYKVNKEEK